MTDRGDREACKHNTSAHAQTQPGQTPAPRRGMQKERKTTREKNRTGHECFNLPEKAASSNIPKPGVCV